MELRIEYLAVACDDPGTVSGFWQTVLGGSLTPTVAGVLLRPSVSGVAGLLFTPCAGDAGVPSGRLAARLGSADGTLKEHVARLIELGASIVYDEPRGGLGHVGLGEVIMQDPEGNQFAVQSSDAEAERVTQALEEGGAIDLSDSYFAGRVSDPPPFRTAETRIETGPSPDAQDRPGGL